MFQAALISPERPLVRRPPLTVCVREDTHGSIYAYRTKIRHHRQCSTQTAAGPGIAGRILSAIPGTGRKSTRFLELRQHNVFAIRHSVLD